jgi:DNA-binding transcriptional LysR family regulator
VNIAIIEALTKGFVPEVIQRLKSEHRYIQTKITVLGNIHIAAAIARGDVDFGIMLNPRVSRELAVRAHAEINKAWIGDSAQASPDTTKEHSLQCLCRVSYCRASGAPGNVARKERGVLR